ncbi:MAG: glycogen synthase GlgA [Acetobacteraceae bacterium]|nr:glycogen synthase GlgA [Acetobacteraceae bacterium]
MKLLAVASEAYPLIKTGGLADVVGALPAALAAEGIAVTTVLPGYPATLAALDHAEAADLGTWHGGPARLLRGRARGLDVALLDAPHLFARPGAPYTGPDGRDWPDNATRFAAFAAAAALFAREGGFDAVHAHDWQAGLVPAHLRLHGGPPSLFTIHNLAFQGQFPPSVFPLLGLPGVAYATQGLEYYGGVGFLKAGLWYADALTTVSPTYAAEIQTPAQGMGLDGLLRGRAGALAGILNGLDTEAWDPATDPHLVSHFSAGDPAPRAANRAALQGAFGLPPRPDAATFAVIGRLTWQKGVDLVLEALPAILAEGAQLVILGTGDAELEHRCLSAAASLPGTVGTRIAFDEGLGRVLYGGADAVLVPSRFEPCGLTQMCAMRYGALPVAARVGGLSDTVVDASEAALAAGWGNGFLCAPGSPEMLGAAIRRAAALRRDRDAWSGLQRNAMTADWSWARSARRYAELFRALVRSRAA